MANRLLLIKTLKTLKTPSTATATRHLSIAASTPPPSAALLGFQTLSANDSPTVFSPVPTPDLLRSAINLHLSAIEPVVDLGSWVMSHTIHVPGLRCAVSGAVRHTFFRQFCAGESVEEAGASAERLRRSGLRGMLAYGVEHADDDESCDRNFQVFLHTVRSASSLQPGSVSSVVVKITAICRISLLRRVSDLLRWEHSHPSFKLPWKRQTLPVFSDSSPLYHTPAQPDPLTPEEERDLDQGRRRLDTLCQACRQATVPLIIDAENTFLQPSIDYLTYSAAVGNTGGEPVVYNTIQAYLKDAGERLALASRAAEEAGVAVGFKLVRGAYMASERKLARSLGAASPIHVTIQATHDCYNDCVKMLLGRISSGSGSRLILATHNIKSGKLAATKAPELGIGKEGARLQFAQLYGMSDALSFGLRNAGFTVSKYMPFGPIDKIIPYLLRRAEENRGLLSSSALDRQLMREELKKRFVAALV